MAGADADEKVESVSESAPGLKDPGRRGGAAADENLHLEPTYEKGGLGRKVRTNPGVNSYRSKEAAIPLT